MVFQTIYTEEHIFLLNTCIDLFDIPYKGTQIIQHYLFSYRYQKQIISHRNFDKNHFIVTT